MNAGQQTFKKTATMRTKLALREIGLPTFIASHHKLSDNVLKSDVLLESNMLSTSCQRCRTRFGEGEEVGVLPW